MLGSCSCFRSVPLQSLESLKSLKNLRKKGDQHLSRLTHQIQKRRLTTQKKSLKALERLKTWKLTRQKSLKALETLKTRKMWFATLAMRS